MVRKARLNQGLFLVTYADPRCDIDKGSFVTRLGQILSQLRFPLSLSFFCGSPLLTGLYRADPAKSERTGATPQKRRDP